jgi:CheY-like chemotaxis protein
MPELRRSLPRPSQHDFNVKVPGISTCRVYADHQLDRALVLQRGGVWMPTEMHRILVVEEDPASRALLSASLSAVGFDVTTTDSALSASQMVHRIQPSAILLDIVLPYRSGAALLADLKADARTADIPVFVVSDLTEVLTDQRRSLAAAVIRKPVRPSTVAQIVRDACDRSQTLRSGSASIPRPEWRESSPDRSR